MESGKKIGDAVVINYGVSGILRNCFIEAIKFTLGKVSYDIKIFPFPNEDHNKELFYLITNVDSYFVEAPEDRFIGKSNMPLEIEE